MQEALNKAVNDLSMAKKGEKKLKVAFKTLQRLASSLRTMHRAANNAESVAQANLVSSLTSSVLATDGVSGDLRFL